MIIDCSTCPVRGKACQDCVVTALIGPPPELELDPEHQRAIEVLADAGLVPKLRAIPLTVVEQTDYEDRRAG